MTEQFAKLAYEDKQGQVSWQGYTLSDSTAFDSFLQSDVSSRLGDEEGKAEFETHLRGLSLTGFGSASLEAILDAEVPEDRDWAVCEAMAEAWLTKQSGVIWPWNTERDKRNTRASLPGADLVGFIVQGTKTKLVLGEVKSSRQKKTPPNVLCGRSGMIHQIDKLANDLPIIRTLLKWLLPRCKGTEFETHFNDSARFYFNSGNKEVSLFGVLVRDIKASVSDLEGRGEALNVSLTPPSTCKLLALYLPCKIADLPQRIKGGEAS